MNIIQYAVYKLPALHGAVVFCRVYVFVDGYFGRYCFKNKKEILPGPFSLIDYI